MGAETEVFRTEESGGIKVKKKDGGSGGGRYSNGWMKMVRSEIGEIDVRRSKRRNKEDAIRKKKENWAKKRAVKEDTKNVEKKERRVCKERIFPHG